MNKNDIIKEAQLAQLALTTRRLFLRNCTLGLGGIALGGLLSSCNGNQTTANLFDPMNPLAPKVPHFAAKAKSVIYIHLAGAPSQLELFDYKPTLAKLDGQDCPDSLLEGKRFAFIRGVPKLLGPRVKFKQWGESGAWVSDHLHILHL